MPQLQKNKMRKLEYRYVTQCRGDKCLFIFPDRPFWFIAHKSVEYILKYFSNRISKETLTGQLKRYFNTDPPCWPVDPVTKIISFNNSPQFFILLI